MRKLRVYFFGTPSFLDIYTSETSSFEEILKQIIQEYTHSELSQQIALELDSPEKYELRLLEDDEDEYYLPLYDFPELDQTKTLNDINITAIAFCKSKKYAASKESTPTKDNEAVEDNRREIKRIAEEQGVCLGITGVESSR
eukprot:TRINITY_DN10706_c0_g3_i2.p3 TRINITY_DN10706_c0_g3~~TRINITY_DN10706_c0_g3_i2.p3  ORF type:complete len:142 (-),score=36.56 TRINITY_DN10706_c0_g3_i2:1001-1426(-)